MRIFQSLLRVKVINVAVAWFLNLFLRSPTAISFDRHRQEEKTNYYVLCNTRRRRDTHCSWSRRRSIVTGSCCLLVISVRSYHTINEVSYSGVLLLCTSLDCVSGKLQCAFFAAFVFKWLHQMNWRSVDLVAWHVLQADSRRLTHVDLIWMFKNPRWLYFIYRTHVVIRDDTALQRIWGILVAKCMYEDVIQEHYQGLRLVLDQTSLARTLSKDPRNGFDPLTNALTPLRQTAGIFSGMILINFRTFGGTYNLFVRTTTCSPFQCMFRDISVG